ncbi:MAG: carbamoyl-phosphate synthase large subunit [Actinobacteria bacterium]|nr:carbamoyl-phosphate synthase large subunit [Actinomycetota bacterium]
MPRRDDLHKIMLIGSGPIVIGQACEFDYSGTQACKVLLEEGYEVILVNSNPATIMTDPDFATRTYIEPLDVPTVAAIIEKERPDALLPTLGGQTALNLATGLHEAGVLEKYGVQLIGADYEAIQRAEERDLFRQAIERIGLRVPQSDLAKSVKEACEKLEHLKLPIIIRPSFTLGGFGGGVARDIDSFCRIVEDGVTASPIGQVLLEESVIGWQEFELEVMRDRADNVVIVCSIENVDPMGVHTGDSVTVAPAQTLTDVQYQRLRDASLKIIREIGVETGGSNIQFAVNPETEEIVVIEMNPRVSRSSALASKATGFAIAKIAARLAVGYTLDEIPNDITRKTPASFEPTIDYVVVKTPRWAFEKFPQVDTTLTTHMKSVGENMAIGRTFKEAFLKSMRSRELDVDTDLSATTDELMEAVATPCAERYDLILELLRRGATAGQIEAATAINPWFLGEMAEIASHENSLRGRALAGLTEADLRAAKQTGFSDPELAVFTGSTEQEVRGARIAAGVIPVYKSVDTCAAEFEAETPYFYSCYDQENEALDSGREKVIILGSGPNRIGQGIEFDYCCVHAVMTSRECGYEAIMVNCNPETVSTDYDISDRLYFEPLTLEDVLNVVENEHPKGVIVQFGGQTPLKIADGLERAGVPILGTPQDAIDIAEDRGRFGEVLRKLGIAHPPFGTARSLAEALDIAGGIGYPLLVRPSYVLGGRAMEIVYNQEDLERYIETAVKASPKHPILLDKFLEDAIEIDVDAVCDGEDVYIGAVMQHIEEAGVHSGDSACVIPTFSLAERLVERVREHTASLALELGVIGLINIQYAVKNDEVYVLEANPRGSRTVPFVSKSTGVPLAKVATRVVLGQKLAEMDLPTAPVHPHVTVKEAVLPFSRLPGADTTLGPEMKSTGEVMGVATTFPIAFAKAQEGAGQTLPSRGSIFVSVCDSDKPQAIVLAQRLHELGFHIYATAGTAEGLREAGVPAEPVRKFTEGKPHVVDMILTGKIDAVINTPRGRGARADGYEIRRATLRTGVPCLTTMAGAEAAVAAIEASREPGIQLHTLQYLHGRPTHTS